jgi:hypothetical protein
MRRSPVAPSTIGLGIVALAVAACIAGPDRPSTRPSVGEPRSTQPAPSSHVASAPAATAAGATPAAASTSPTPELPTDPIPRSARTDERGIRVAIVLDRNPMPVGEPTWVTTRVTNTGTDDLIWFHDACAISVSVGGGVEGAVWRPGRTFDNPIQQWKGFIADSSSSDRAVRIDFTPEAYVGRGSIVCADVGISDVVKPRGVIEQRAQWDGLGSAHVIPPPTGKVRLTGTFRYGWHASEGEPSPITNATVSVELDAWVIGDGVARIDPPEAIDAALGSEELLAVLGRLQPGNANDGYLRYDPETNRYAVGIVTFGGNGDATAAYALVDATSGEVVGWKVRPWDFDAEGNP